MALIYNFYEKGFLLETKVNGRNNFQYICKACKLKDPLNTDDNYGAYKCLQGIKLKLTFYVLF